MAAAVGLLLWTVICLCTGWSSMVEGVPFIGDNVCDSDWTDTRTPTYQMGAEGCSGNQKIYLGHELPEEELENIATRRSIVQQCLSMQTNENEVPNIALIGSGGGERAMVSLLATVLQLEEEGLMDCIMYMSGVSGSTWALASLYKEENWSRNVPAVMDSIFKRLSGDAVTWEASGEKLKKYYLADTENYSLTEFWAALAVTMWVKEIDETYLSAQSGKHHQDPYPIFAMIDKDMVEQTQQTNASLRNSFVEITIPEVGYTLAGAFVDQINFGSEFNAGTLTKNEPQLLDMLYLQGLCGSALADMEAIKKFLWNLLKDTADHWLPHWHCSVCEVLHTLVEINHRASEDRDYSDLRPKMNKLLEGKRDNRGRPVFLRDTRLMAKPAADEELKRFTVVVCDRLSIWYKGDDASSPSSFHVWTGIITATSKAIVEWKWGTTYDFLYNMPANANLNEVDPAILQSVTRSYMDSGVRLNSPYFQVLRKERQVDLVISIDVAQGNPMKTVMNAHQYAKELGIPFPPVPDYPADFFPDDIYVFRPEDPEDKITPTVIHMPLFNKQNCGNSQENYYNTGKEFSLLQTSFDAEQIQKLKNLAAGNVINAKAQLLEEIQNAFARRRS